jgi:hypothetical protein
MAGQYSPSPPRTRNSLQDGGSAGRMTTNFEVGSQENVLYGVGIEFESGYVSGGQVCHSLGKVVHGHLPLF